MKNYIVGYGSLINQESQKVTGLVGSSTPIILKDYCRSWTVLYDELSFCALGVYPQKGSDVNGVLFEVTDLESFDKREHGYNRVSLKADQIQAWSSKYTLPLDGDIWIYLPFKEKYGFASEAHYIWQSYIDVILMGCLSVDDEYAKKFIVSTELWNRNFFKDDRNVSEYLKKLTIYDPAKIDQILAEHLNTQL